MKKLIAVFVAAIASLTLIQGCTKDPEVSPTYNMHALVTISPLNLTGCIAADTGVFYMVGGVDKFPDSIGHPGTYPNIVFFLPVITDTGTYPLTQSLFPFPAATINFEHYSLTAQHGTIRVTSLKPDITGTYEFICTDSTRVSNGNFTAHRII